MLRLISETEPNNFFDTADPTGITPSLVEIVQVDGLVQGSADIYRINANFGDVITVRVIAKDVIAANLDSVLILNDAVTQRRCF